jgi:D-alanyl-D-alanine carboxypeptidase (penicillin-binding protein 5/6)
VRGGRPGQATGSYKIICSWALFLLLSLGAMFGALAKMAGAEPTTSSGYKGAPPPLLALGGAVGVTIGSPPRVTAPSAFVYDADTGTVYYAKNADEERPMASTTKVMTILVAVERGNLDQVITVGADAAALVRANSSYMGLSTGEKLTLRDLLYGLILPSGNDAAVAIADGLAGSVPKFVALMNAKAKELGLTHTHFVTPHGLDLTLDGHYTTARDLAVLSGVAMKNPAIVKITAATQYRIPRTSSHKAFNLVTGDDLLSLARSPYTGAIGVKPGFTGLAGFCQSFAAIRHGHLVVGAVLGDPSWQVRITDMRTLLDYGFAQYGLPPAAVVPSWTAAPPDK